MTMTTMNKKKTVFLCLLMFLMSCASLCSQEKNGKPTDYALIFINVYDAQGRTVYGAPIKIRRVQDKKAKWEGFSDHQGEFGQRLPVGKQEYIVWLDLKDKVAAKKSETKVNIESNERVDISLHLN
jgi:hypothetical protein